MHGLFKRIDFQQPWIVALEIVPGSVMIGPRDYIQVTLKQLYPRHTKPALFTVCPDAGIPVELRGGVGSVFLAKHFTLRYNNETAIRASLPTP